MFKAVLVVTIIMTGQPPVAYHIEMTPLHCDLAKEALEKDYALQFSRMGVSYSIICLRTDI